MDDVLVVVVAVQRAVGGFDTLAGAELSRSVDDLAVGDIGRHDFTFQSVRADRPCLRGGYAKAIRELALNGVAEDPHRRIRRAGTDVVILRGDSRSVPIDEQVRIKIRRRKSYPERVYLFVDVAQAKDVVVAPCATTDLAVEP